MGIVLRIEEKWDRSRMSQFVAKVAKVIHTSVGVD